MDKCQCDANVARVERRFKCLEQAFENQVKTMSQLEHRLKEFNPPRFEDMSINFYFSENAKLGKQGQCSGIIPEKSFEQLMQQDTASFNQFRQKYMRVVAGHSKMHPCFFYCLGRYSYYASLVDSIREEMWHQNRYIMYLQYLIRKESGQSSF